jgi:CRISPR/Cas system CSM-associated protein Csm5 (group 7 of RAMP superfamily)
LENAKNEWELLLQQKENEANEAHQKAMNALEQKHLTIQTDMTMSHRKQVDDLRNFYTMSMSNAKKEAESQKQSELAAQKATHESFVISLTTKHEAFIISERNRITDEKDQEISDLTDDYDKNMKQLQDQLNLQRLETENLLQLKTELESQLSESQGQLELNLVELGNKEREIEAKT